MICYVGLAILAGVGAMQLARLVARHRPGFRTWPIYALIAMAFLYEQRVAPLALVRGEADPDAITLRLRETPMRGGIVEVPIGGGTVLAYRYMLRAADHARPIVTATSSFIPPIAREIESLSQMQPIPNRLLDLLEEIPASYLVVHNASLLPASRLSFDAFLNEAAAAGRLRFVRRFGEEDDLYAVTKTEPQAVSETQMPAPASIRELTRTLETAAALLPQNLQQNGYFIYRLHRAYYGRLPRLNEFLTDLKTLQQKLAGATSEQEKQEINRAYVETWMANVPAKNLYDGKTNEQYVDALFANMETPPGEMERAKLIAELNNNSAGRESALLKMVENNIFYFQEFNRAFVSMMYFGYLQRNPDDPPDGDLRGLDFWLTVLNRNHNYAEIQQAFINSDEYNAKNRMSLPRGR